MDCLHNHRNHKYKYRNQSICPSFVEQLKSAKASQECLPFRRTITPQNILEKSPFGINILSGLKLRKIILASYSSRCQTKQLLSIYYLIKFSIVSNFRKETPNCFSSRYSDTGNFHLSFIITPSSENSLYSQYFEHEN